MRYANDRRGHCGDIAVLLFSARSLVHAMIGRIESGDFAMGGDADSKIAWHRVQLRKNRDALKSLESSRFTSAAK